MGYSNDKPSMFDDMPKHIGDAVISEISDHLFECWIGGHLDEGMFLADYEMAFFTNDPIVRKKFNEYWEVKEGDEHFLEVDDEI